MSIIDELATSAADELREAARTRTDTAARRRALDRTITIRRRSRATLALAAATIGLLLGTTVVAGLRTAPPAAPVLPAPGHTTSEPPRYTGDGPILVYTTGGFELVDPATGVRTPVYTQSVPATERMGWSPDGSHLATFLPGSSPVLDMATGETTFIDAPEREPLGSAEPFSGIWFPTGRVVWSADGTFSLEGAESLEPVAQALPKGARILWVTWSPDGRQAAFVTWDDASDRRLYVANADGTGLHELPAKPSAGDDGPFAPVWSPDGSRLLYSEVGPIGPEGARWSVMTIGPDGSDRTRVTDGGEAMGMGKWETYPVWSPDSQQIAFLGNFSATENGWGLYVTDLAGHVHRVATGQRPQLPALAWRPVP